MIIQNSLLSLLNEVTGQTAKVRKGGIEAVYFCSQCNHYKRKCECLLEPPYVFHCWVCQVSGTLFSFLKLHKASANHYIRLQTIIGNGNKYFHTCRNESPAISLPQDFVPLFNPTSSIECRHAINYLKNRGVTMNDICRYNIGFSPRIYENCVVVPSYDEEGKLNYFSSRYIYPHTWFKYKNAPFSKNVVGFECFINYDEPVTLVEGVFDAIAVRNNAIPLFGTTLSKKLKDQLVLHRTKRVNVVLDNDAMEQAIRMVEELWKWGIDVHLIKLKEKDPSEIGFNKIHELIENSSPVEFKDIIRYKLCL